MKKKQKLSKEAQEIAELYTRLEILKSKQIEGVKTTRYTTDAIRACQPNAVIYIQGLIPLNESVIAATGGGSDLNTCRVFQRNTLPP